MDPRFIALFSMFYIKFPAEESLNLIYNTIISSHVAAFDDSVKGVSETMTSVTMQLYKHIVTVLPPTPAKFHYIFNLRDLSKIYEGLSSPHRTRWPQVASSYMLTTSACRSSRPPHQC